MKLEEWREIEDFENEVEALKFLHARLEGARKNRNGLGGVEIDYLQKLVKQNMVNVEAVEKLKKFSRIMDCKRFSKIYPTTALEDEGIEKLKKLQKYVKEVNERMDIKEF
jgi:hypothetical protein